MFAYMFTIAPATRKVVPTLGVECYSLPGRQAAAFAPRGRYLTAIINVEVDFHLSLEIKSLSSLLFSLSEELRPECSKAVSDRAPATTAHRHDEG
jgi:hypothetical protein